MGWFRSSDRVLSETEQDVMMKHLRKALPPCVSTHLERGGEEGTTDLILRKWLTARKASIGLQKQEQAFTDSSACSHQ